MKARRIFCIFAVAVLSQNIFAQATRPAIADEVVRRLTDPAAPDEQTIRQLLGDLKDQAIVREAAIRRLLRHPSVAARPAVDALAAETLAARTAILDLLRAWHAPIDGIDPWQTDSLTPERTRLLREWAASVKDPPATRNAQLSPDDLAFARGEIDRMLASPSSSPDPARVIRERLARFGEALLPEVYARLSSMASDDPRRRLIELRYRLVASDRLALTWGDGLERLASGQPRERIAALDDLAGRASQDDQRLLLELFSDPDPFVRERSLKLLKSVGGDTMTGAMAKLLADPEPNVRAAVLKQLLEKPPAEITDEVIAYVGREKETDLLVQAARVLRALKSQAAVQCLSELLGHESWRVRAEAVDGIKELAEQLNALQKAMIYTKVIRLLDDPDGFVIARAVEALRDARLATAIEPMARAAQKHPEIAGDVVTAMTADDALTLAALPYLKEMRKHADPAVRAAAVVGVSVAAPRSCGAEIEAGLKDSDPRVRIAAADALFDALCRLRTGAKGGGGGHRGGLWFDSGNREQHLKLAAFSRESPQRPAFLDDAVPLLEPMLSSAPKASDRAVVAAALISAGHQARALPTLESIAKSDPAQRVRLIEVLPWLPWEARLAAFGRLVDLKPDAKTLHEAVSALAEPKESRAVEPLWRLLANTDSLDTLEAVYAGLSAVYFGERYYQAQQMAEDQKKPIIDALNAKAASGSELQKSAALALLLNLSPDDAVRAAESIRNDPKSGEWLRIDAMQIQLLAQGPAKSDAQAAKFVADPVLQKVAVPYLALHEDGVRQLRGRIWLYYSGRSSSVNISSGQPIDVSPPPDMPPQPLTTLMAGSDERLAATAGYLLALTGSRDGYRKLEAYWRAHAMDDNDWRRLVYRAITALNDDTLTPVLEEIYHAMGPGDYTVREFYWTIRGIKGPNILKLRKQIRDQVGMQRLQ